MKEASYGRTLEQEASIFKTGRYDQAEGEVEWTCPSNIAIVKYWGKKDVQIPMNPSLSLTLERSRTRMRIAYRFDPAGAHQGLSFTFEGQEKHPFVERIRTYLHALHPYLPFLSSTRLDIDSDNSFPHSSGIASSASAMGALALCLIHMETRIITGENAGGPLAQEQLRKASFLARLGSGSACRSLFPGFALWGETDGWAGSGNEYAIPVDNYHEVFRDMRDSILIVESGRKKVSSSTGHSLMASNPFADTRFRQARMNLDRLSRILGEGNWDAFIEVMEEEALSLHAMMMTGKPGYLLMRPGTLAILEKVRSFREKKGARLGFTLDAGANVHLLYPPQEESRVHEFMNARLLEHCENRQVIHDRMGAGPQLRGI